MEFITEFNRTGECKVDVDLIIENWQDHFAIYGYSGNGRDEYKFVINGDKKEERPETKCQISESQATEIIEKLNLIRFNDLTFRLSYSFRTKDFYISELVRLGKLILDKKTDPEMQGAIQYAKQVIRAYSLLIQ